jgi:hypothetical protein
LLTFFWFLALIHAFLHKRSRNKPLKAAMAEERVRLLIEKLDCLGRLGDSGADLPAVWLQDGLRHQNVLAAVMELRHVLGILEMGDPLAEAYAFIHVYKSGHWNEGLRGLKAKLATLPEQTCCKATRKDKQANVIEPCATCCLRDVENLLRDLVVLRAHMESQHVLYRLYWTYGDCSQRPEIKRRIFLCNCAAQLNAAAAWLGTTVPLDSPTRSRLLLAYRHISANEAWTGVSLTDVPLFVSNADANRGAQGPWPSSRQGNYVQKRLRREQPNKAQPVEEPAESCRYERHEILALRPRRSPGLGPPGLGPPGNWNE